MTRYKKLKDKIENKETRTDITFTELTKYLNYNGFIIKNIKGSSICGKGELR